MIKNYLIIALRNFLRNKMTSLINIAGLALGISACLVIFVIARHELSYDRFHPDKERIYRIVGSAQFRDEAPRHLGYVPSPLPMRVREQLSGLEQVVGFYNYYAKVSIPQSGSTSKEFEPLRDLPSPIIVTEPDYFDLFRYEWLAGNWQVALTEPFQVVLSAAAARKYFPNEPVDQLLGRTIVYNDSLTLAVSGIVKDWKLNTDFAFTDFISFATVRQSFLKNAIEMDSWGVWDYYSQALVKLAPGTSPEQVEAQFPGFVKENLRGEGNSLRLQPLADIHFNSDYADGYSRKAHLPTLYTLMGIAIFILLIAIINFINLATAQSVKRTKEIGVRKVLGGSRTSLRLQFFTETFLLALCAALVSLVMLNPILSLFRSFIPDGIKPDLMSGYSGLFLLGVIGITTLLAGFYPARVLSSFQPALTLKGQHVSGQPSKSPIRRSLIVFQFAISLVFILGSLIVHKQIHFMLTADMGFDKNTILVLRPGREQTPDKKILLAQQLQQLPGVSGVSLHAETPAATRHGGTSIKSIGAQGSGKEILSSFGFADANYLPLYDIKLIVGRNLLPSDTLKEFVINANAATALGFKNPEDALGQMMEVGIAGKKGPVVGIMEDFHSKSLHEAISPFFVTTTASAARSISVKLNTADQQAKQVKNTIANIEKLWKNIYPDKAFSMGFLDETIAAFYEKEQKTAQLINTAMAIAVLISCMGLLGLVSFTTEQRRREIGIRKVLGAGTLDLVVRMSKDLLPPVLIGLIIASPVAYYFMHKWLEDFAYRTAVSWWLFITAGLAAIMIALLTVSYKTIRTARANPVKSLRTE